MWICVKVFATAQNVHVQLYLCSLVWMCVLTVCLYTVHTSCVYSVCVSVSLVYVCVFCRINHAPVESCATVAVSHVGGLCWDVGSECLLFAIIVVIMASLASVVCVCSSRSYHYAAVLRLSIYCTDSSQEFPPLSRRWRLPLSPSPQFSLFLLCSFQFFAML